MREEAGLRVSWRRVSSVKALPRKARLRLGKTKAGFMPREPSDLIHSAGSQGSISQVVEQSKQ